MASPLSGLLKAIQQRSSANFHLGVCAAGLLSSSLWAIYAMVIFMLSAHQGCGQLLVHAVCPSEASWASRRVLGAMPHVPCFAGHLMRGWCAVQTIKNLFLAIPSLLGGLLSCASLLVCFVFPR